MGEERRGELKELGCPFMRGIRIVKPFFPFPLSLSTELRFWHVSTTLFSSHFCPLIYLSGGGVFYGVLHSYFFSLFPPLQTSCEGKKIVYAILRQCPTLKQFLQTPRKKNPPLQQYLSLYSFIVSASTVTPNFLFTPLRTQLQS